MNPKNQPLVTFVRYARNDAYAPDYERRLNLSTQGLIALADLHSIPIEILFVEWNPPANSQPLKSIVCGSHLSKFATVRVITVPSSYHFGFEGAASKGLHPAKALNVGYRRAKGKFITPFSSDSFLTATVFEYIATKGLNKKKIYRLDRFDVDATVLQRASLTSLNIKDIASQWMPHIVHHHKEQDEQLSIPAGIRCLHTNAAGDFLLMSKNNWHKLGGQPEDCDVMCLDTDSITLHAAATLGINEIRLPTECRLYKIAHTKVNHLRVGPVWDLRAKLLSRLIRIITRSPKRQAYLRGLVDIPRRRMEGIPGTYASFERNFIIKAQKWAVSSQPVKLNSNDWGLKNVKLEETSY